MNRSPLPGKVIGSTLLMLFCATTALADVASDAQTAANNGDVAAIKQLLDTHQIGVNDPIAPVSTGNTMLLAATYWGQIHEVRFLIRRG